MRRSVLVGFMLPLLLGTLPFLYAIPGDEGWGSLTQFADQLITQTDRFFERDWKFTRHREYPFGEFSRFTKLTNPKEFAERRIEIDASVLAPKTPKVIADVKLIRETRGRLLLRGEEVSLRSDNLACILNEGMIAASGHVQISSASCSVIVAGGDAKKSLN